MGRRPAVALLIVVALVAADGLRAPDRQLGRHAALAGIHLYQATVSRLFAVSGVACRFSPTCSHYAEACVERFGWLRGGGLALRRVLRCGPWTPLGTVDPPPATTGG
jgi:putative membrane protein insertion efficiency factor